MLTSGHGAGLSRCSCLPRCAHSRRVKGFESQGQVFMISRTKQRQLNNRRKQASRFRRFEALERRDLMTASVLFSDNLNDAVLGPPVDEKQAAPAYDPNFAWTDTPPVTPPYGPWVVDDSGIPLADDPAQGVEEWKGWSFANKEFWIATNYQDREQFVLGKGVVAVADPDEWDDQGDPEAGGFYNAYMTTPVVALPGGTNANSLFMSFDSSWRWEGTQTARLDVRYDGGPWVNVLLWESDPNSANFKDDSTNEHVDGLALNNPSGAANVEIRFGLTNAKNNWWWAVDNIELKTGSPLGAPTSHYLENFESVTLLDSVDETLGGMPYPQVWTDVPPAGWTIDDSGVPGAGTDNDGVTEWAGWSLAKKLFWVTAAEDQGRNAFVKNESDVNVSDNNIIAIADSDEWDDLPHPDGTFNPLMISEPIDLTSVNAVLADPTQIVQLRFDSSWRPEPNQTATVEVSYDGGVTYTEIVRWSSDAADPDYKGAATNEVDFTVTLPDPQDAPTAMFRFGILNADNNWWWAIDDVEIITRTGSSFSEPFFVEDFEDVPLGPPVDEAKPLPFYPDSAVWTGADDAVPGWTVENTLPGIGDPAIGVTEWEGWSFADPMWWAIVAENQNRAQATKLDEVAAISDPDEWDDKGSPTSQGAFNSLFVSPLVDLTGVQANTAQLTFDSSWRPEDAQTALVEVSYDGGTTWVQKMHWTSTNNGATAGDPGTTNEEDQTVTIALDNPSGAAAMQVRFGLVDAVNNWWWAIDNIRVTGETTGDQRAWEASAASGNWHDDASWSGTGAPTSNWETTVVNSGTAAKTAVVSQDSNVSSVRVSGVSKTMTLRVDDGAQLAATSITLGPNAVLAGGGHVVGDVTFDGGGTVFPGSTTSGSFSGELDIVGDVGPGGTYVLQVGNPKLLPILPLYAQFVKLNGDSLDVTEAIDLSGTETLSLSFTGSASPSNLPKAGQHVLMVASEGITGAFETINADLGVYASSSDVAITALGPGGLNLTDEPAAIVTVTLQHDLLGGDANLDGKVNAVDLSILAGNFLKTGTTWRTGDFNGDGRTNAIDLSILSGNYLKSIGDGGSLNGGGNGRLYDRGGAGENTGNGGGQKGSGNVGGLASGLANGGGRIGAGAQAGTSGNGSGSTGSTVGAGSLFTGGSAPQRSVAVDFLMGRGGLRKPARGGIALGDAHDNGVSDELISTIAGGTVGGRGARRG